MRDLQNAQQKSSVKRIFPVVFHVLHQGGNENISDAQISDAMLNLNEDFQKLNADTADVVSPFDTIIGNPNFEFRLATIDPNGNPTNGIDRIYTPLTNNADDFSKINQWDPSKYINIWVVRTIGASGLVAYTYNPLETLNPCTDGIIMLNDYIGTIGTSMQVMRHFLTHEMGHFFGLYHLSAGINNPGVPACDYSDGIYDTPHQSGSYSCNMNANSCNDSLYNDSFNYWGYDVIDMVYNLMSVTYCSSIFTKGQASMMRAVHENPIYGRWSLSDSLNLITTGVASSSGIAYALPNSDFGPFYSIGSNFPSKYDLLCAGSNTQFKLLNGNPANTQYLWSFPGGNPSTDTIVNPIVNYTQPGFYDVSLTATNSNGSNSTFQSSIIYVSGDWGEYAGPTVLDLDTSGAFWLQYNKASDINKFTWIPDLGQNNSGCFRVKSRFNPDTTVACWQQSDEQINGNRYDLITPAFDLRNTTSTSISFDYAHGSSSTTFPGLERIKLFSSRDCGRSWTQRISVIDTAFNTAFILPQNEFAPVASEWRTITIPYTSSGLDNKTRFKIEYTASNESNYLYIDNFRIDGVLGISDLESTAPFVYPNPLSVNEALKINELTEGLYRITLYDLQGKLVQEKELVATGSELEFSPELIAGYYLIHLNGPNGSFRYKLIIE